MISESINKMRDLDLESEAMSNVSDTSSDSDICDYNEVNRIFNQTDNLCEKVIANNKYILHVDATRESESNIVVALSDYSCEIHKLSNQQVATLTTFIEHKNKLIGCKFSKLNQNLVYSGASDSTVALWDIRTPKKSVINFLDTTVENGKFKTFSCLDISSNERLLAVGTELFEGDAFLLFWDVRNHKLLGGYWESHTDDITKVKFHFDDKDKLLSGSTDGLINIYDLSQPSEEDALSDSLNTESSIDDLLWFNENAKDKISCITHTSDLQLWSLDGAEPYKHFTRADIARELKKKKEGYTYLANVHNGLNSLLVLAGSNFQEGECLRGLRIKRGEIQAACGFNFNKQRVRCSWFNPHTNILLTGGEKGILNVWRLNSETNFC